MSVSSRERSRTVFLIHPGTPLVDVPADEAEFWFGNIPDPHAPPEAPLTVLIGGSYYFDRERMHPLIENLPQVIVLRSRLTHEAPEIGADPIGLIVDLLGAEHDNEAPGSSAAIPALLDLLLAYILRAAAETADSDERWAALVRDRAITGALLCMQNQPQVGWTVETLARHPDSRAQPSRAASKPWSVGRRWPTSPGVE